MILFKRSNYKLHYGAKTHLLNLIKFHTLSKELLLDHITKKNSLTQALILFTDHLTSISSGDILVSCIKLNLNTTKEAIQKFCLIGKK